MDSIDLRADRPATSKHVGSRRHRPLADHEFRAIRVDGELREVEGFATVTSAGAEEISKALLNEKGQS